MAAELMRAGQLYRREDCAGFWRRVAIDCVDLALFFFVWVFLWVVSWDWLPAGAVSAGLLILAYCYFVLLKRTRFGTLGYLLYGVKAVGLDGKPARIGPLTLRFLFAALGPLNIGLDLLFVPSDSHRQAMRDTFAGTYVVRRNAVPLASGRVVYRYYEFFGYNFLAPEVVTESARESGC